MRGIDRSTTDAIACAFAFAAMTMPRHGDITDAHCSCAVAELRAHGVVVETTRSDRCWCIDSHRELITDMSS
jgi:hypothetical protein